MRIFYSLIFCYCLLVVSPSAWAAQTCYANIAASTPDSRLTDNINGTITDTRTGLMWKKCVEGVSGSNCESGTASTFTWQTALKQPGIVKNSGGFAGYTDWRLPNIKELRSIVEVKCFYPAINLTRFPNTQDPVVWSGSPHFHNPAVAWDVDFWNGASVIFNRDYPDYLQVRLVRGGR
jgi:hypothetical protein